MSSNSLIAPSLAGNSSYASVWIKLILLYPFYCFCYVLYCLFYDHITVTIIHKFARMSILFLISFVISVFRVLIMGQVLICSMHALS